MTEEVATHQAAKYSALMQSQVNEDGFQRERRAVADTQNHQMTASIGPKVWGRGSHRNPVAGRSGVTCSLHGCCLAVVLLRTVADRMGPGRQRTG